MLKHININNTKSIKNKKPRYTVINTIIATAIIINKKARKTSNAGQRRSSQKNSQNVDSKKQAIQGVLFIHLINLFILSPIF